MAKRWTDDPALMDSLADHLLGVVSMFPKRFIHVDELVRTFHMPLSHIQVLVMVAREDLSIGQISEHLGVAKPNITPLVDALVEKQYVSRLRNGKDHRIVQVHLLPKGRECLQEVQKVVRRQISEWPVELSRSEMKQLNNSLAQIVHLMDDLDAK